MAAEEAVRVVEVAEERAQDMDPATARAMVLATVAAMAAVAMGDRKTLIIFTNTGYIFACPGS